MLGDTFNSILWKASNDLRADTSTLDMNKISGESIESFFKTVIRV